ncbi:MULTISPECIES: hypothetical protein [unclassified Geodermatophilus]
MTDQDRHERVEAARLRAEMTVRELWLRYIALGGNGDLFDLDAYLNGLLPLADFDQNVLAVAVNERLEEVYRAARVPLVTPLPDAPRAPAPAADLRAAIARLLDLDGASGTTRPQAEEAPPTSPRPATRHGEDSATA